MKNNSDYKEFRRLFPYIEEYQRLAATYNIADIFQDNGGKYLELLILLGLKTTGKREGNDAFDGQGNEFEIKTVNIKLTTSFSTHHHMNPTIIAKYRKVHWFFAVYEGILLRAIFKMAPQSMEPYYKQWESKWHEQGGKDINNPKVPVKYVIENGEIFWLPDGEKTYNLPLRKRATAKKAPIRNARVVGKPAL